MNSFFLRGALAIGVAVCLLACSNTQEQGNFPCTNENQQGVSGDGGGGGAGGGQALTSPYLDYRAIACVDKTEDEACSVPGMTGKCIEERCSCYADAQCPVISGCFGAYCAVGACVYEPAGCEKP